MLREIIDSGDRTPGAWLELGNFYADAGEWEEALRWYRRGLEKSPQDREIQKRLATGLTELGCPEEANEVLKAVLAADPDDTDARSQRAFLLAGSPKPETLAEALDEFQALRKREGNSPVPSHGAGLAYASRQDLVNARRPVR